MWHLWQTSNQRFTRFWYLHTKEVFFAICDRKKRNLSKKVVDYQICTYIFGVTWSPSCSNFTLKKTATDNSGKFGQEAAKNSLKNFYVDDLLKSTKVAEEAVSLPNLSAIILIASSNTWRRQKSWFKRLKPIDRKSTWRKGSACFVEYW